MVRLKIYDRDYNYLTEQEIREWKNIKDKEIQYNRKFGKKNLFPYYPAAVRHKLSLFPNNYLDPCELKNEEKLLILIEEYMKVISNKTTDERDILNWIRDNKAYHIIASILKYYPFGHHDAYIFPEFQLGNSYRVDYLLIGKGSGGYEFIFVELEHPYKKITLASDNLGETFRKGLYQVDDWNLWLQDNFKSLYHTFNKYKNKEKELPHDFIINENSRFHFVVVAGRREHFSEKTYAIRRQYFRNGILLLHYDNLYDMSKSLIGKQSY